MAKNIYNQIARNAADKNEPNYNLYSLKEGKKIKKKEVEKIPKSSIFKNNINNNHGIGLNHISEGSTFKNNLTTILTNSLYMEKLLFLIQSYTKAKQNNNVNNSRNFEEEFTPLHKDGENSSLNFEKKYLIPPKYSDLKSDDIIERNKSYKKLYKKDGRINLFEVFSNETLQNYNNDQKLLNNNLDLKVKFKNKQDLHINHSLNFYSKNKKLNKRLCPQQCYTNNISNFNRVTEKPLYNYSEKKLNDYKKHSNLRPRIILRHDIINSDEENNYNDNYINEEINNNEAEIEAYIESMNKLPRYFSSRSSNKNQVLEDKEKNRDIDIKSSSLKISAENIINQKFKNEIFNEKKDTNLLFLHDGSLNQSNYSQELKRRQNEYWIKRRKEPYKYIQNNTYDLYVNALLNENINDSNEKIKNKLRSTEIEMNKSLGEKKEFDNYKILNSKKVEYMKEFRKQEFKQDIIINREKMNLIESSIKNMVIQYSNNAWDSLEYQMLNHTNDNFVFIEK